MAASIPRSVARARRAEAAPLLSATAAAAF